MNSDHVMYPEATDFASPASTVSTPPRTEERVVWGGSHCKGKEVSLKSPLLKVSAKHGNYEPCGLEYVRYRLGVSNRTLYRLMIVAALFMGVLLGAVGSVVAVRLLRRSAPRPWWSRTAPAPLPIPPVDAWKHAGGTRRKFELDGRLYWVYEPAGAQGPLPVLFVLHGSDDTALVIANTTRFEQVADEADSGFLVVLPEMVIPGGVTWSFGGDEQFFRGILEHLDQEYTVKRDQVFVCGHSNGGTLALYLQNNMPDVFRAAGAVEAGIGHLELWQNSSTGRPVMIIWNHNDNVLAQFGGEGLYQQTVAKLRRHAPAQTAMWPAYQEALPAGQWQEGGSGVLYAQRQIWPAMGTHLPELQVISWASATPSHHWLNPVLFPGSTLDASVLLWEFFRGLDAPRSQRGW